MMRRKISKLRNVAIQLSYDGTNYFGWQIQNRDAKQTVQGELEKALAKVFAIPITTKAAGRTDRGVHAKNQIVSFPVTTWMNPLKIKNALSASLPPDIQINQVYFNKKDFHARFSARAKIYRYHILNRKKPDVFLRNFSWHVREKLDMKVMQQAAKAFVGKKDFRSLINQYEPDEKSTRIVHYISIKKRNPYLVIEIKANSFLRGMVRNIVALLVEAGLHQKTQKDIHRLLFNRRRDHFFQSAPPQGLYLTKVFYS